MLIKKLIFTFCVIIVLSIGIIVCTKYNPVEPKTDKLAKVDTRKSINYTDQGIILDYEMPTYQAYYYNYDPTLDSWALIKNPGSYQCTYTVKFRIIDPCNNNYEIDSKSITVPPNSSKGIFLQGDFSSSIISGFFTSIIELRSGSGQLLDSKTLPNAFSAFRRTERFSNLNDYSIANSYIPEYGPYCPSYDPTGENWGYDSANAEIIFNEFLQLSIPYNQQTTRKGGAVDGNEAIRYTYGLFKANIKIDTRNTDHVLGAFWLSEPGCANAINIEIYKQHGIANAYTIDCHTYVGSSLRYQQLHNINDLNFQNNYYEYDIEWYTNHIRFYFGGLCIAETWGSNNVPSGTARLSPRYCLRMVPNPGPHCPPPLPSGNDATFMVSDAAY